ncbi:helix-turn-helix domain-containing protein [Streptomyces laurentii]|uniref:nSTAND1 domain-containing NTPase n=1 Tax=Streptomyces laurentii TaxID=39478 RepID=UPI0036741117
MGRRETPLDPAGGPVQRFADELRKLRREAGGLTYREMARRAHYSVTALSQAAAGEQLPSLAVTLAYVAACGGDAQEWERRWRETAEESVVRSREDGAGQSPYQGLARFETGDHERFFGRGTLVEDVRELVLTHSFAAVFGPSGSGKSSLLRAGLIPALRAEGASLAEIRVFTPGEHPLRTHAKALRPKDADGDTVLVVDQFEEAFTLCRDVQERTEFIAALLAARRPDSRLRVVIAVRADFYGRCAEYREFADALREANLLVGPMNRAELREVVVRPAQTAGLIVERELTARLVEAVDGEAGGLPLLSHALRETWRRRRGRALTMEAYEAAGGVHGAIAKTAEEVYTALSADDAELARLVLLRLITPGEGSPDTRRPVDPTELDFAPAAQVALVLDRLAQARLITLDDNTVDLAHEALITSWPRLRTWVEETRDRLRTHRRLTEAAAEWEALARDPGALYRGTRLATADEHLSDEPLTPVEQAFLTAGRTTHIRELRRRRTLLTTLSTLLALALVAGATAWQQSRTSDRRHLEAEARRIAAVADGMRATDPVTAARLSVASWQLARTVETRSAVLAALNRHEQDVFRVPERDTRSTVRRLTGDGRSLVSASSDHVRVWDLRTHRLTHTYPGPGERLSGPGEDVISPDGRTIALSGLEAVTLWDIRTGRQTGHLRARLPMTVAFSGDGHSLVVQADSEVQVWDVPSHRLRLRVPTEGKESPDAAISADGRRLATCGTGHPLRIWDIARRVSLPTRWTATYGRGLCSRARLTFSPDGTAIGLGSPTGVLVRDIASGREIARLDTENAADVRFSPDGAFVASIDEEGQVLLWRLASPDARPVFRHTLGNETADHYEVDFAAGVIRYLDGSGTAVRSLALGSATTSDWRPQSVDGALLSQNGRTSATLRAPVDGKGDNSIRLWDTRTGKAFLPLPDKPCPVEAAGPGAAADLPREPRADNGTATADGEELQAASERVDCLDLMAMSADGRSFAYTRSGTDEEQPITVWDTSAHRRRANITVRPDPDGTTGVDGLALSPDGRTLYVSRATLTRQVLEAWDVPRGIRIRTLDDVSAQSMAIRDDQRLLVTAQGQVTDLRTGRTEYRALGDDMSDVLAFSPDGAYFAAGDAMGQVTVWDGDVRTRVGVAGTGPGESITALAFSPDGRTLAVSGSGGTVQLWDVASSRPLGSALPSPGDLPQALAFDRDGTTLYVAGSHVQLWMYDIAPAQVARQVCARTGSGLSRADWKAYLPGIPYRRTCLHPGQHPRAAVGADRVFDSSSSARNGLTVGYRVASAARWRVPTSRARRAWPCGSSPYPRPRPCRAAAPRRSSTGGCCRSRRSSSSPTSKEARCPRGSTSTRRSRPPPDRRPSRHHALRPRPRPPRPRPLRAPGPPCRYRRCRAARTRVPSMSVCRSSWPAHLGEGWTGNLPRQPTAACPEW